MDIRVGKKLIKTARAAISSDNVEFEFKDKKGVFVTLYGYPKKNLRGCIGFIEPIYELSEGVFIAAKEAAFGDPRFPPISAKEKYIIEVSILSKPELLEGNYLKQIKIGRDGLIVEKDFRKGLLLPKVAVEHRFSAKQFLDAVCIKAHLDPGAWKADDCNVYIFQTEVFGEESPGGKVRKIL